MSIRYAIISMSYLFDKVSYCSDDNLLNTFFTKINETAHNFQQSVISANTYPLFNKYMNLLCTRPRRLVVNTRILQKIVIITTWFSLRYVYVFA